MTLLILRRVWIVALTFCLLPSTANAADVNERCPVLGNRKADADITTTYRGKEVRFCCNECKVEFEANPEIYVDQLPQLQKLSVRDEVASFLDGKTRWIVAGILAALLIGLMLYRRLRNRDTAAEDAGKSLLSRRLPIAWPLAVVVGMLAFEVYTLRASKHETYLEDNIHFATFYDYGFPPVPKRPDTPPRVRGTYYRGNDERSPKLFNNGNYRTATFHVSICDKTGHEFKRGDEIEGRQLFIKLVIDRPPFTPDFLYSEELMAGMYLTRECDRFLGASSDIPDRVNLTTTEPEQRWEARFPIGKTSCCAEKRDIIYVCEEYHNKLRPWSWSETWIASRFHYGLVYDIRMEDGKLADDSDLYMGTLYRTRKFPAWKVPITEWFSHKPIPVLPGETVEDPVLLGTSDHRKKVEK